MIKLYEHQEKALEAVQGKNKCAFYLDMGLGKTFCGSEKAMSLKKPILVVCQKSKVKDWCEHFKQNYLCKVVDLTEKANLNEYFGLVAGQRHMVVGVINYDLIWRRSDFQHMFEFTLILDESSMIQNESSKRSKFILQLSPQNTILLSGTPTSGKYENLWSQMHLLGWKISKDLFDTHYVNWKLIDVGGMKHKIVDMDNPYKNEERLKQKMRDVGCVFMKTEDVLSLPQQNVQIISVDAPKQYKKFCKNKIVTINGKEYVGDTIFAERLCKRQICTVENPNKLEAVKDLIESTNDRLVIFYQFNDEYNQLKWLCKSMERPFSTVNGSLKDLTAYENESNSITLCQYQSASMGLNLQLANKIIYYSYTEQADLFQQSMKRIHRIGQQRPCFYYLIVAKNTIEDEEIIPTLELRKELTDELFKEAD